MHIITMGKIVTYKSYMWKLYNGEHSYCFQSKDPRIKRKMARRKDFSIFNAWSDGTMVYVSYKKTSQSAKRTLTRLTGSETYYISSDNVYMAKTHTIVTSKKKPQTTK